MLGLILNETCGMANTPQAWTLAAAEAYYNNRIKNTSVLYSHYIFTPNVTISI